ncbi:hypothetical protein JYP46_01530 [Nitratireductor aquimarinus]|uniref:hypothetical protein n=1 Tax=Alphaproteobacteria TaxID=28211 RepID=UPI0019D3E886|nr:MULTISPECIES: hypothetical protein [Alphaproteobacteria]MBN7755492.1 hypothetical protein [Nitratireductor aquimarinus]MBY5998247.1 hypothetical protein [Tritonibacter mobilis]MBY6020275.1 hypothetical protein [Nitratireductor sp. DP7N14-4]
MYQKASPTKDKYGNSLDIGQPNGMNPFQVGDAAMPQASGLMAMSAPMQSPDMGDAQGLMAAPAPVDMAQAAPDGRDAALAQLAAFAQLNAQPRQPVQRPVHPFNQKMADMVGLPTQRSTQPAGPPVHPFNQKLADMVGLPTTRSAQPQQRRIDPLSQALLKLGGR